MLREVREIVSANIKDILLLLGCYGLPSLKMGLVFFFFFSFFLFSSGEKLQFLRNFACIRLNDDAAAV